MSSNRHIPTAGDTWGKRPNMKAETFAELTGLLEKHMPGKYRRAVEVCQVAVVKTIDNEEDAKATITKIKEIFGQVKP